MQRMFRTSSDALSVKAMLSLAVLAGIAAGVVVPLAMSALGMLDSQATVTASATTDVGDFPTAAGTE
jgi:hypothetical protein